METVYASQNVSRDPYADHNQGTLKYPKKTVFFGGGEFVPSMETFLECETICREPPPIHVFIECLAETDGRKVAIYLRQVNEVNGGDNVFVRCVSVCLCFCLCTENV